MALFNITATAENACGAGATQGATLPVGPLTVYGTCPYPSLISGLTSLTANVDSTYSATFRLASSTGVQLIGGPAGINISAFDRVTGIGTLSGIPMGVGSFPIVVSALNACGGGDTTTWTQGIGIGTLVISGSVGSVRPSAANTFESSGSAVSEMMTVGTRFNSDGSTTAIGANVSSLAPNWFGTTTPGIGSSYWVRANPNVVSAGLGFFSGSPHNVWLPLSSNPAFTLTNQRASTLLVYDYTYEFATDAAGNNIVATHTSCTIRLEHEETNG